MKYPDFRVAAFDSVVELELYVADSVRDDPALVSLGNVAGAVYQGAVGPMRDDLEENGCEELTRWMGRSMFDPDKVWAQELESGETYSITVDLLFVLVKEPDDWTGAGDTYWECLGEVKLENLLAAGRE